MRTPSVYVGGVLEEEQVVVAPRATSARCRSLASTKATRPRWRRRSISARSRRRGPRAARATRSRYAAADDGVADPVVEGEAEHDGAGLDDERVIVRADDRDAPRGADREDRDLGLDDDRLGPERGRAGRPGDREGPTHQVVGRSGWRESAALAQVRHPPGQRPEGQSRRPRGRPGRASPSPSTAHEAQVDACGARRAPSSANVALSELELPERADGGDRDHDLGGSSPTPSRVSRAERASRSIEHRGVGLERHEPVGHGARDGGHVLAHAAPARGDSGTATSSAGPARRGALGVAPGDRAAGPRAAHRAAGSTPGVGEDASHDRRDTTTPRRPPSAPGRRGPRRLGRRGRRGRGRVGRAAARPRRTARPPDSSITATRAPVATVSPSRGEDLASARPTPERASRSRPCRSRPRRAARHARPGRPPP